MKPTIEAIITFEGKSTLFATASVLSRISLALLRPFLIVRINITSATAIIIKMTDQIETRMIKAISSGDISIASVKLRSEKIKLCRVG